MSDAITVDRARYEALENLATACHNCDPPLSVWRALNAIPPETPIEMEGWDAYISGPPGECWVTWRSNAVPAGLLSGPTRPTEREAIAAGNAMLREIAGKVKP